MVAECQFAWAIRLKSVYTSEQFKHKKPLIRVRVSSLRTHQHGTAGPNKQISARMDEQIVDMHNRLSAFFILALAVQHQINE